jgi:uncharacterized protein (UPF0332 family)
MTEANRAQAAAAERRAALAAYREAADLHRLGHPGGTVSRAYYATYHAARALLFERGLEPKTHEGVRRMIGLHFVLTGALTAAQADALAKLAYLREAADYAPAEPRTPAEADEALLLAKTFLSAAKVEV